MWVSKQNRRVRVQGMDADVEMVDNGFSGKRIAGKAINGLFIESSLSTSIETIGRQNRCFVCMLMCLLVGVFAYYTGLSYNQAVNDLETVDGAYKSEIEEFQDGVNPKLVAEGMTKIKPHLPVPHRTGSKPKTDHNESTKASIPYQDWLDATVTLSDGKMYEIIEKIAHGKESFTEGLTFGNGKLYESIGLNGRSAILELDPNTGVTIDRVDMHKEYFAEGLAYINGKLIQLTYKHKTGFIYDATNLKNPVQNFTFSTATGEGWGMTYDHDRGEIIVSDGSNNLLFWDPATFVEKRRIPIMRIDGGTARNINELEYWRGRVIANIWFEDSLLVIHPETGKVEKEYDLSSLWPQQQRRNNGAEVLNGISVSEQEDVLYVTGKNWDRMFKVRYV